MPESKTVRLWNEEERDLLDALLDQIIPPGSDGRIPGAGALGVADFLASRALEIAGLADLVSQGLAAAAMLVEASGGSFRNLEAVAQVKLVKELELREPAFFAALLRHTYMGYYTDPKVPPLFGLTATAPQPDGYEVPDEEPEDVAALVESVINRGRCYREC